MGERNRGGRDLTVRGLAYDALTLGVRGDREDEITPEGEALLDKRNAADEALQARVDAAYADRDNREQQA